MTLGWNLHSIVFLEIHTRMSDHRLASVLSVSVENDVCIITEANSCLGAYRKGLLMEISQIWKSSFSCAACIHLINTVICPAQSRLSGIVSPNGPMQLGTACIAARDSEKSHSLSGGLQYLIDDLLL